MKKDLFVVRKVSQKNGSAYLALVADFGYRQVMVSYDANIISEFTGLTYEQLYSLPIDEMTFVGSLVKLVKEC